MLLAIGLAHMFLLWRGDILTIYAVVGLLVLLPSTWLPRWAVAGLAAVLIATPLILGSNGAPLVPGLFLLGSALTRYGVIDRIERSTRSRPRWAWSSRRGRCPPCGCRSKRRPATRDFSSWFALAGLLIAGVYVCALLVLLRTPLRPALQTVFAPLGRMALTNYLSATLLVLVAARLIDGSPDGWSSATVLLIAGAILAPSGWCPRSGCAASARGPSTGGAGPPAPGPAPGGAGRAGRRRVRDPAVPRADRGQPRGRPARAVRGRRSRRSAPAGRYCAVGASGLLRHPARANPSLPRCSTSASAAEPRRSPIVTFETWRADARRRAVVERVRREQRLELARELHDVVAHHITGSVLQTQAARIARRTQPETLDESLAGIEAANSEALAAMRRVVGLLRDTDDAAPATPGPEQLSELVDRFAGHLNGHGPVVQLQLPDPSDGRPVWPPEVTSTVYRVVQESLTNIARHAPHARSITVSVAQGPRSVTVEVVDDAASAPALPHHRGGYGLIGIRERVGALDGTLTVGPRPAAGWYVRATLPLPALERR